MKVKICGLCRPPDAHEAARLGADYVGVILAPGKRRSQSIEEAAAIFGAVRHVGKVGVFVDPTYEQVAAAHQQLALDVVQLHGTEAPELVERVGALCTVWKALAVRAPADLLHDIALFAPLVGAVVLDHGAGGSGAAFDWTEAAALRADFPPGLDIVMAGGLTPSNVAAAIQTLDPAVVDVSTGVEASLCEKSAQLMREFISNAKDAAPAPRSA